MIYLLWIRGFNSSYRSVNRNFNINRIWMCVYLLFLDSIKIYWIENQTVRMRSMLLSTIELFVIRVWNGNRKSFDIFSDSWYDCQNEKQREKENLRLNQPVRHSFNIHNEPLGVCTSYKSIEMWCDAMWCDGRAFCTSCVISILTFSTRGFLIHPKPKIQRVAKCDTSSSEMLIYVECHSATLWNLCHVMSQWICKSCDRCPVFTSMDNNIHNSAFMSLNNDRLSCLSSFQKKTVNGSNHFGLHWILSTKSV